MDQRSPVHEILNELWRALHEIGSPATTGEIERWGFSIHAALSAAGREFHNHDHVIDLVTGSEPLEVIAALYHDVLAQIAISEIPAAAPRAANAHRDGLYRTAPKTSPPA